MIEVMDSKMESLREHEERKRSSLGGVGFLAMLASEAFEALQSVRVNNHRIGAGERTIFTLHNRIAKSHAGKPDSYFRKPNIRKGARP